MDKDKDTVSAKVVGPREVAGAAPGEVVELDPAEYNIAALVEAGHVEIRQPRGKKAATPEDGA